MCACGNCLNHAQRLEEERAMYPLIEIFSFGKLAEKIEHEWETVWSCEGLSDEQLVNAILEFVRGEK